MKVLIADDDELVLEVYSQILQAQPDFDVTTACDANDACEVLRSQPAFDLVLLDLGMPGMEGFAGLRRVIELLDDGIVAIMSGREDAVVARDAIAAGAAGFIPKTIGPASLPSAVRSLVTGPSSQAFDVVQAAGGTRDADKPANLTARESAVLACLRRGLGMAEIAQELSLKEITVKLQIKTVCRKMGVEDPAHLAE